jgi:serine/threonine-protein kinase RsbW
MEPVQSSRVWVIPARLESVSLVCVEMKHWLAGKVPSSQLFSLQILAREALNNAVLHGCAERAEKQVRFEITIGAGRVCLQVEDDGPGFDWQPLIVRKMVEENQEFGRGLYIYRMYADLIEFNPTGNCVCLSRHLPDKW